MSLLITPFSTQDLKSNDRAFDYGEAILSRGKRFLKSGDIFELKTDNPKKKPLPSFRLLEMQWFLMCIVGMAGTAGPYEPDFGDDLGDKISNLGLNEVVHN